MNKLLIFGILFLFGMASESQAQYGNRGGDIGDEIRQEMIINQKLLKYLTRENKRNLEETKKSDQIKEQGKNNLDEAGIDDWAIECCGQDTAPGCPDLSAESQATLKMLDDRCKWIDQELNIPST